MLDVSALQEVLRPEARVNGMPQLAAAAGASQLCVFLRDPELNKFLPAPGFPQTLPSGFAWSAFLKKAETQGCARDLLPSPFSGEVSAVTAKLLENEVILVLFGAASATAHEELAPAIGILTAIFRREVELRLKTIELRLVRANAVEARQLARSLSEAHERLAAALQRGHDLGQEVHRQQETLDLARQISGIGLWTFDFSDQTFSLSGQAASILGVKDVASRLALHVLLDRVHPEDRRLVEEAFTSQMNDKPHNLQFRLYWDQETLRWIENRGVVMMDDQRHLQLNGLSLDITDRVRTEDALIRSEKLAAAGRLAATIAHEINNPLESLVNLIYIASTSDDIQTIREVLHQADSEISRVSAVARQTLAFYRDLNHPVEFDVRTAIEQSLQVLGKEADKRSVTAVVDLSDRPALVRGWVGELKQVFSNLFLNALHASQPGSRISTRIRANPGQVVLLVGDHGHGISQEHLPRIFEPFFSTRKEGGTGLGLWVTRQIVQKHGGSLAVRSSTRPDRHGTVFRIVLPAADHTPAVDTNASLRYRWLDLAS